MQFDFSSAKKIVVTGGAGFLGQNVLEQLKLRGAKESSLFVPRSSTHDIRDYRVCRNVCEGADLVIHLAAKVGGIGFNQKFPGDLFYNNCIMGVNIIEAARLEGVKKVVVAGTICAYPKFTPVPFQEEKLWEGYPEETNAPYGVAKKALQVMLDGYHRQYKMNGVFLLPVNLYGPGDNFDLEDSHVIPALIRKFHAAKLEGKKTVTLWGDGSPTREFLYVEDCARAIVLASEKFNSPDPVNLGSQEEISIRALANLVQEKIGFDGEIEWDESRPNGQPRRKLDVSKADMEFGFKSEVSFQDGLERTIKWWEANYQNYK